MLDIGWSEMLVIGIILILVVGPKDLPRMLRTFGRTMTKVRSMAGEFRSQFDEALKEAELDDVRKTIDGARKLNPTRELRDAMNPLKKAGDDVRADIDRALRGKPGGETTLAKKDPAAPSSETPETVKASASSNGEAKPASAARPATTEAKPVNGSASAATASSAAAASATTKPAAAKAATSAAKAPAGGKAPAAKPAGAVKAAPKKTGATRKAGGSTKKAGDA